MQSNRNPVSHRPFEALLTAFKGAFPRPVREHEILRVSANIAGKDPDVSIGMVLKATLQWAQKRTVGKLPEEAWNGESFEHFSGGRSCICTRFRPGASDIWAVRVEDPDKETAGRIWTTEIAIGQSGHQPGLLSLRLLVASPEGELNFAPATPGVLQQVLTRPGLTAGPYPIGCASTLVKSPEEADSLIEKLIDKSRRLPVVIFSVSENAADDSEPLLNAQMLARQLCGLAHFFILPAPLTWKLTTRFGKALSVYGGAVRMYLPGFGEDANPFAGHELLLPNAMATADGRRICSNRLRWIVASASLRNMKLGSDVLGYATIKAKAAEYESDRRQHEMDRANVSEREHLAVARLQIATLRAQAADAIKERDDYLNLYEDLEDRAENSEIQMRTSGFRIQQLLDQLIEVDVKPDANIPIPAAWDEFANWCDSHLAGRVSLAPRARRAIAAALFADVAAGARCLLWLANDFRSTKSMGGGGSLREIVVDPKANIRNAHCGSDTFSIEWQGKRYSVEWHLKNGGNTRDPNRCLRVYYFWDDSSQQVVVASMPGHIINEVS